METSLHRELKDVYARGAPPLSEARSGGLTDRDARLEAWVPHPFAQHGRLGPCPAKGGGRTEPAQIEAPLGPYRIDVVRDDELIEIQHGPLAVIRDKVRDLLRKHRVLVVKPIIVRKRLVKRDAKGGAVISRRLSPKRGREIDLFGELIHFTRVFPHPNLCIETPLVDVEEWRYPGHGRRRWRRDSDHVVEDRKLVALRSVERYHSSGDLMRLLPDDLPTPFHTGHLAEQLGVRRHVAQRIAYCLQKTGAAEQVGKTGNAWLYRGCG